MTREDKAFSKIPSSFKVWRGDFFECFSLQFKILPRMLGSKDIPLLRQGNMGINFRDIDRTVSQHFLNITDINIRLQKAGGKCVPEHMGCKVERDGC